MIGVFAKMFGSRERVEEVEVRDEGYAVRTRAVVSREEVAPTTDAPPAAFVEKVEDEGGVVYAIPFIEALRGMWRRKKEKADPQAASAESEEESNVASAGAE